MSFKYNAEGLYIQTSSKPNIHEQKSIKIVNQLLGLEQFSDDEYEHFDTVISHNEEPYRWINMAEKAKRALPINPPILKHNDFIEEDGYFNYNSTFKISQTYDNSNNFSSYIPLNSVPNTISSLSPASVNGAALDNCCNGSTFSKCLENENEYVCMENCKNICPLIKTF
jgi:hypothetical protein